MNLRKLLSGLLALCLLLTMAPAALMEALPEEQVVELGDDIVAELPDDASEVVEVEQYYNGKIDDASAELTLPDDFNNKVDNGQWYVEFEEDGVFTINAGGGYTLSSVKSKNARILTLEDADAESATFTMLRMGDAVISLKLQKNGSSKKSSVSVTVHVYDPNAVTGVKIVDAEADDFETAKSIGNQTLDLGKSPTIDVAAVLLPYGVDGDDIYWTSSNTKVAVVSENATLNEEPVTITAKGKGSATITAKCKGKSAKITVKVTDKYAPTKIRLYAQKENANGTYSNTSKIAIGQEAYLYTVVTPAPFADQPITFTLDSTSKAALIDEASGKGVKTYTDKNNGGTAILLGKAEGTVKITAKTYNGKTHSIKLTVYDPFKPDGIQMYGFYNKETYEIEKSAKRFLIVPELYAGSVYIPWDFSTSAEFDYANIKWETSNKKVATIKLFKNYEGYSQTSTALNTYFGEEVYESDAPYGAVVELKGTGTTKLTAKYGKKSFSITLKVIDSYAVTKIVKTAEASNTQPVGEVVDLNEFFEVLPYDHNESISSIGPSHSTSKITNLGGGLVIVKKAGTYTFKVKMSGGKSLSFKVKFK